MPGDHRFRGWIIPAVALVVAAAAITAALLLGGPGPEPSAGPSSIAMASPTPRNDHLVEADDGVLTFGLKASTFVVTRQAAGTTTELGRVVTPREVPSPDATPVSSGSAGFVMLCPNPAADRRYLFGYLDGPLPFVLSGAAAVGHAAADGTFLFELAPGTLPGTTLVEVRAGGARAGMTGVRAQAFDDARTEGVRQASGCWISG